MSALSRRKTLRLILMSATISTDKFAAYLGTGLQPLPTTSLSTSISPPIQSRNNQSDTEYGVMERTPLVPVPLPHAAPVMFIPGYTYPVVEYYKNNFEESLRGHVDLNARRPYGEPLNVSVQDPLSRRIGGMKRPGDIDYDLLVRLIVRLALGGKSSDGFEQGMFLQAEGSVLIFLPGVPEINRTIRLLEEVWGDMVKPAYAPELKIMPL